MDKLREAEEARERIYILREEAARKAVAQHNSNEQYITGSAKKKLHDPESDILPICHSCGQRIDVNNCSADAAAIRCKSCENAEKISRATRET